MVSLRVLESEDICLLLSSFLSQHACWTLRHVARNVLSDCTAPRVRRALAWRQELGHLFTFLDVILSSCSPQRQSSLVGLQEIRNAFAASPCRVPSDERLGQILALADDLLVSRQLNCGEPGIVQRNTDGGELKVTAFPELYARHLCFEASLASMTQELACNQLPRPSCMLSEQRPKRRRLSRQPSVMVPKGAQVQRYGDYMTSYINAKSLESECERWIALVRGADSARLLLEQLFAKGSSVTVERVVQILTSNRSTLRLAQPLPAENVPAALLLLVSRTADGLVVETVRKSGQQDRSCFQSFQGASSERSKMAFEKQHLELRRRHRHLASDVKQAFMAMIPGSSDSVLPVRDDTDQDPSAARAIQSFFELG